ncbi:hypothetical protein F7734_52075 [Scytonema sp. UIC 10036]|uniref:GIY-YIG nuclease family protein n=1 Tax=Scytonema sp. UIC 10036 TaxID=2304196 RepID=UPI0012DA285B|nr:GIY-YIG nuclease family protein [Scytonema sp. UIC 10036]MUH00362.1 hypothetical protein [Scytonema sp. UIC 10036]
MTQNASLLTELRKQLTKMPEESGVYSITLGQLAYVGESRNIKNRVTKHLSKLKSNRHYNKTLTKAFLESATGSLEVLELCRPEDTKAREKHWGLILQPRLNEAVQWDVLQGQHCSLPHLACGLGAGIHPLRQLGIMFDSPELIDPMERFWRDLLKAWRSETQYQILVEGERIYAYHDPSKENCEYWSADRYFYT